MNRAAGGEFRMELDLMLAADPDLTRLSRRWRSFLFQLWEQKGDRESLAKMLASHPQWQLDR